jgi:hypothetical protein
MSKVLDYLETDKAVDAKKVAVQGHSRDGKAALVALAYDERFLTGFISSSGQSGAKLHRRKYGEAIENIAATNEYHWMAGNYLKYAGRWDTLPVDSHELVALVAPRPVFLKHRQRSRSQYRRFGPDDAARRSRFQASRGPIEQQAANINDAWVDPKGNLPSGRRRGASVSAAREKDLGTTEFPKIETGLVSGEIAFRQTFVWTHAGSELAGVSGFRGEILRYTALVGVPLTEGDSLGAKRRRGVRPAGMFGAPKSSPQHGSCSTPCARVARAVPLCEGDNLFNRVETLTDFDRGSPRVSQLHDGQLGRSGR